MLFFMTCEVTFSWNYLLYTIWIYEYIYLLYIRYIYLQVTCKNSITLHNILISFVKKVVIVFLNFYLYHNTLMSCVFFIWVAFIFFQLALFLLISKFKYNRHLNKSGTIRHFLKSHKSGKLLARQNWKALIESVRINGVWLYQT